ncbi:MAG TPA: hypothetical protein VGA56_21545 [Opitutaceae bacterium]
MAAPIEQVKPVEDGTCDVPCGVSYDGSTWAIGPGDAPEFPVLVDDLNHTRCTTAQWIDETSVGTTPRDMIRYDVKVWFLGNSAQDCSADDDDFHRVHLSTLRTP